MPDSIDQITYLLSEAKKARAEAEKELAETQAKLDQINDIQIRPDASFSKTSEALAAGKENFAAIREYKEKAKNLSKALDLLIESMANIDGLRKKAVFAIKKIHALVGLKRYEEAMAANDQLEADTLSFESEIDLVVKKHILEIVAWNRCSIWNFIADINVAKGVPSLPPEQFEKFAASVEALPLGFHTEEAKKAQEDKLLGFRCYDRGLITLNAERSLEDLKALLALLDETAKTEDHLLPTKERIAFLHGVACEEYNRLAEQFFDLDRNYDRAHELFLLRGYFEIEEITHDDYRLAKDETDFRLRFLDKEALREDDSEFSVSVYAYADSIRNEDELEFEILTRYALLNGLSEEKVTFLYSAANRLNFEQEVLFLGDLLERGLIPERHAGFFHGILAKKHKTLDLEKCAKALLNCKTMLDEPLRPAFEELLKDLLRSPHARKVLTKSARPEAHALIGEDLENFNRPWGRPVKNPVIKSWDFFNKVMFVTFAIILPASVLLAAFIILIALLREDPFVQYYLLAPLFAALFFVHVHIVARFGIDERGSAVYRRTLGLVCLGAAILSLVFYILPGTLVALKPVALTALIFGGAGGLWGFFVYKDKKKLLTALIYVPLMLCVIAAIIMMVVAMSNGAV